MPHFHRKPGPPGVNRRTRVLGADARPRAAEGARLASLPPVPAWGAGGHGPGLKREGTSREGPWDAWPPGSVFLVRERQRQRPRRDAGGAGRGPSVQGWAGPLRSGFCSMLGARRLQVELPDPLHQRPSVPGLQDGEDRAGTGRGRDWDSRSGGHLVRGGGVPWIQRRGARSRAGGKRLRGPDVGCSPAVTVTVTRRRRAQQGQQVVARGRTWGGVRLGEGQHVQLRPRPPLRIMCSSCGRGWEPASAPFCTQTQCGSHRRRL